LTVFKSLDKALDWLNKHDPPDEVDWDCNIKHRILYGDGSDSEWLEFISDKELKNWIQEQYDQMEDRD
jgi:hypothetical protein